YDRLFDRIVVNADLVVVNSAEMDLRDLHKLAGIATRSRSHEACALTDMMWVRLRPLQELIARFFDDETACACLSALERVTIEFSGARFEIERQEDPHIFRWSREAPGAPVPPQTLRVGIPEETTLLTRCLEHPKRDRLFEKSLGVASRLVRSVAPRLSGGL